MNVTILNTEGGSNLGPLFAEPHNDIGNLDDVALTALVHYGTDPMHLCFHASSPS
jgi:hypothetical protein